MTEWVLGVSASHNGGACLLLDGELAVAVQEERLTRTKRTRVFPAFHTLSIKYCLEAAGIEVDDLTLAAVSGVRAVARQDFDLTRNPLVAAAAHRPPVVYMPHHRAHAMAACFQSGFEEAAVLVIDGQGSPSEDFTPDELAQVTRPGWETLSIYRYEDRRLTCLRKDVVGNRGWLTLLDRGMPRFSGIGGMYSAVAHQIFGHYLEAGKVMGLAPLGSATIPSSAFFEIEGSELRFQDDVPRRFSHDERWPNRQEEYAELAASVQAAVEEAVVWAAEEAVGLTGSSRLVFAGGVALNCPANERIIRELGLEDVFVIPAAEDSGVSIGAAAAAAAEAGLQLRPRRLTGDEHGRAYSPEEICAACRRFPSDVSARRWEPGAVAQALADGAIIGWFSGGSELGPRALGHRSILADPRAAATKEELNRRKGRESFRPLAPIVPTALVEEWFDMGGIPESPFMLRVCPARLEKRDQIPAVVHVDGTARVQTVDEDAQPELCAVLAAFRAITGVPVLINTSFNAAGEPIVETPEDALWCAQRLGLDLLVLEDLLVPVEKTLPSMLHVQPGRHSVRRTLTHEGTIRGAEVEVETPWGTASYWLQGRELETFLEMAPGGSPLAELGDRQRDFESLRRKRLVEVESRSEIAVNTLLQTGR